MKLCYEAHKELKLPGQDGSWMGDYATFGSYHLAHAMRFAREKHENLQQFVLCCSLWMVLNFCDIL